MQITKKELEQISLKEELEPTLIENELKNGRAVILRNSNRKIKPVIVGKKFKCKINVNLGISPEKKDLKKELLKLKVAIGAGADCVMDLSVGNDAFKIRSIILENSKLPVGTVPVYNMPFKDGNVILSKSIILEEIEKQASQGVDFMTIHCGLLRKHLELVEKRVCGIVSRGGAIVAQCMAKTKKENPFYEYFDDILKILKKYSVVISLGDGLRPGSCIDASDKAQYAELSVLGELRDRCFKAGVGAMIEGPGHVPINLIKENVEIADRITKQAPLYFLGPLTIDNAMGLDHISAAIGAAIAGFYGVSLLCVVTPAEHIGLPDVSDIKDGVLAFKIACESVNLAKGFKEQKEKSYLISKARFNFDWQKQFELALDSKLAKRKYYKLNKNCQDFCSMCGRDFCAMRKSGKVLVK